MFEIRPEHMDAFKDDQRRKAMKRLCGLLPDLWPGLCITLGADGVSEWVDKGFEKAKAYGLPSVDGGTRYVHLMFMLVNPDFDTDERTSWAGTILNWKGAPEGLKLAALEKRARQVAEAAME